MGIPQGPAILFAMLAATLGAGCTTPEASPTGQIDGAVLDAYMQPLGGATVTLVELDREDQASELGGFTFRDVPPGLYTLTVDNELGRDEERVLVRESETVQIILQVGEPEEEPQPVLQTFSRRVGAPLATPSADCGCGWQAELNPAAESVTLEGSWFGRSPDQASRVVVELWGGGVLLADLEVHSTGVLAATTMPGEKLPDDGRVELRVTFPGDLVPEPMFGMETRLRTYAAGTT